MDIEHNKKIVRRLLDEVVGQGDMALIDVLDPYCEARTCTSAPHSPSTAAC